MKANVTPALLAPLPEEHLKDSLARCKEQGKVDQ